MFGVEGGRDDMHRLIPPREMMNKKNNNINSNNNNDNNNNNSNSNNNNNSNSNNSNNNNNNGALGSSNHRRGCESGRRRSPACRPQQRSRPGLARRRRRCRALLRLVTSLVPM